VVGHKANVRDAAYPDVFGVMVHLPIPVEPANLAELGAHCPRFYVLTSAEIACILAAKDDDYPAVFRARNQAREPPLDKGVPNVALEDVRAYAEAWHKVSKRLSTPAGDPS